MIEVRPVTGLGAFFAPRGIAVVGASDDPHRVGGRTLINLPKFGYRGAVYPISRSQDELLGYKVYRSIEDVPDPVDLAILCVGTERVPEALRECGRRGVPAAVVYAGGFGESGAKGQQLQAELAAAQLESGVRVIGPNTIGIRLVQTGMFATFAHDIEGGVTPGSVAMIAQSGGLGVYFGSAYLRRRGVGTRYLIDTGNELDVGSAECLEYVTDDPEVSCVGLILEGTHDGRRLAAAVRHSVDRGTPVVFLKTGRSVAGVRQTASHTGALAGSARLFEEAMRAAGAQVARDEVEFADALVINGARKAPRGRRLGVVTPSGGFAILTLDAAEEYGMDVPAPAIPPTAQQLADLSVVTEVSNPLDYTATIAAGPAAMQAALEWLLHQPNIDAVITWQAYSLLIEERRAQLDAALAAVLPGTITPLFGCGITTPEFEEHLRALGVLWFEEPTRLIRSLALVAPSGPAPVERAPEPAAAADARVIAGARARALLTGIEHVETVDVPDSAAAERLAERWGRCMLKVESERSPHKTELGLVAGPLDRQAVPAAFARLLDARRACGDEAAPIVAQRFERGVELALGAYVDATFGPAVMVGTGGIFLEVIRDMAVAVAPISEAEARRLILGLRGAPLLLGTRGRPRADVDAAAAALATLSRFIAAAGGAYSAIDVNPLIVRDDGHGAVAVDALLVRASEGSRHG